MSQLILYSLVSVSMVSLISLSGVFAIPIRRETLNQVVFFLLSLATGAMLSNAVTNLVPESFEKSSSGKVWLLVAAGLLFCYVVERLLNLRCHHSGDGHCRDEHFHPSGRDEHEHGHSLVADLARTFAGPVVVIASFQLGTYFQLSATLASGVVLLGVVSWFALIKATRCRPCAEKKRKNCCKDQDEHKVPPGTPAGHIHATGIMSIFSHAMDNFMDGVLIAVAYQVNIEVGLATTLAIVLHEIPMEFGGFGVLINAGFSRWGAIAVNFGSALIAMAGTASTLYLGTKVQGLSLWLTPICAAIVLHITLSGLMPQLYKETDSRRSVIQLLVMVVGIALIFGVHMLLPE